MYLTLTNLANTIKYRAIAASSTIPSLRAFCYLLGALFVYATLAVSLGFKTKFLEFKLERNLLLIVRVILIALLTPALSEELFFRVLLLPHPSKNSSLGFLLSWIIISLFSFVIYHPLNGLLVSTSKQKTFIDPTFLILATGLGIFCTSLYLNSGSLWIPVVFHWTVVVVWLLCLGGNTKLKK